MSTNNQRYSDVNYAMAHTVPWSFAATPANTNTRVVAMATTVEDGSMNDPAPWLTLQECARATRAVYREQEADRNFKIDEVELQNEIQALRRLTLTAGH